MYNNVYNSNRSHYLKWVINNEWSIRYFFKFEKERIYENEFVLKSHYTKDYIILDKGTAVSYIKYMCKQIHPKEYFSVYEYGRGYRRIVIDNKKGLQTYIE